MIILVSGMLRRAGEQLFLALLVSPQLCREVAEGGGQFGRIGRGRARAVFESSERGAEALVLAGQRGQVRRQVGAQAVERREVNLLLEREMRIEGSVEAAERLPHLDGIAAFERAQRGGLDGVEIGVLARDAPRFVREAQAESGLVAVRHVVRSSTAVL